MGRSVQSFSKAGSDLRTYLPGATARSFRTGLVTPLSRRAVTRTVAPAFGATGAWRTSPIGAAPAAVFRARATRWANRTDRFLMGRPPAEWGGTAGLPGRTHTRCTPDL